MHYETIRGVVPADTLLIHGNLASNLWWEPMIKALDGIKSREESAHTPWQGTLIMAEWRGCGKSAGPSSEADMNFSVLANDYLELLESLGIQRVNVVGHATGAMIAMHAMLERPENFRRAVLLSPVPARGMSFSEDLRVKYPHLRREPRVVSRILERSIYQADRNSPAFAQFVEQACNTHPLVWAHILKRLSDINISDRVGNIKQPTLVLHGEHDNLLSQAGSQELADLLPEGRFELLDHQGHCCHFENPERFTDLTFRYLFG